MNSLQTSLFELGVFGLLFISFLFTSFDLLIVFLGLLAISHPTSISLPCILIGYHLLEDFFFLAVPSFSTACP